MMKIYDKICATCKGHNKCTSRHSSEKLYVIDRTKSGTGDVEIHEQEPDIKGVTIANPPCLEVYFDGFPKRAFKINNRESKKQCEGVLFPCQAETDEWMLFIETKYASDLEHAQKPQANYIETATIQIQSVVAHFRETGIIEPNKKVYAIISFPLIDDTFDSWAFTTPGQSVDDIRLNDGIIIRCTNKATIFSEKVLLLGI